MPKRIHGLRDTADAIETAVESLTVTCECFATLLAEAPQTPINADVVKNQLVNLATDTAALAALILGESDTE